MEIYPDDGGDCADCANATRCTDESQGPSEVMTASEEGSLRIIRSQIRIAAFENWPPKSVDCPLRTVDPVDCPLRTVDRLTVL